MANCWQQPVAKVVPQWRMGCTIARSMRGKGAVPVFRLSIIRVTGWRICFSSSNRTRMAGMNGWLLNIINQVS